MKWLIVLLVPLLAGCIDEEPDETAEASIWGTCPQYISGESMAKDVPVEGNSTLVIDFNTTSLDGHALDLYELQLASDGPVELRFYVGGRQLGVTLYEPEASTQPFVALDGDLSVAVYLSAIDHDSTPNPGPLRIEAQGTGHLHVDATSWFRVCGRV